MAAVLKRVREIVEAVNKQVAVAENRQKLFDIQRRLDTSGLDKMAPPEDPICREYRNVDLTKHRSYINQYQ